MHGGELECKHYMNTHSEEVPREAAESNQTRQMAALYCTQGTILLTFTHLFTRHLKISIKQYVATNGILILLFHGVLSKYEWFCSAPIMLLSFFSKSAFT